MTTMTDWFFFRNNRKSFRPNPSRDRAAMFCHQDVQEEIAKAVEKAYALGDPIKMIWWGDWGTGKTHSLRHLEYWLTERAVDFPTTTIYMEIGDLSPKSSFSAIHKDLLDGIGLNKVVNLVHGFNRVKGQPMDALERLGAPTQIRETFNKLLFAAPSAAPPDMVLAAWNYLRGEDVGNKAGAAGLPRLMTESKDFYWVLACLGHLTEEVDGKKLLFLVDEAAKLDDAGLNQEMERHWVSANKMIFDQDNIHFGFIYTVSGKNERSLPPAIWEAQIQNRLGRRLIQLKTLPVEAVRSFIGNLTAEFIDWDRLQAEGAAEVFDKPEFSKATYPFTSEAFERFLDYWQRSQENSKPRDITDRMDDLAFDAFKRGKRFIDDDLLTRAEM